MFTIPKSNAFKIASASLILIFETIPYTLSTKEKEKPFSYYFWGGATREYLKLEK